MSSSLPLSASPRRSRSGWWWGGKRSQETRVLVLLLALLGVAGLVHGVRVAYPAVPVRTDRRCHDLRDEAPHRRAAGRPPTTSTTTDHAAAPTPRPAPLEFIGLILDPTSTCRRTEMED